MARLRQASAPATVEMTQGDIDLAKAKPEQRPLLVIDGDSFAHRAYHGVPKSVRRAGGKGGNAILGFANYLIRLWEAEQPRAVFVGWDKLSEPNWRARIFPTYQGGRIFEESIVDQLNVLPDLVAALGCLYGKGGGYEADDFIASAATSEEEAGGTALVASGDRDAFQLASAQVTILNPVKAGEIARIGPAEVMERYSVQPSQVPDFIALRGDPSDKIPGAKGVGAVSAASLLRRYPNLEAMLADGRFEVQADDLRLYKKIATMERHMPLPPIPTAVPDWATGAALARQWELNGLADRLGKLAEAG
ncbi:MAG: 5'-3' exonuclease H3TH domain-containing protein [Devosia sp.]